MREIPVAIVTSLILNEADRRRLASQDCAILNKSELSVTEYNALTRDSKSSDARAAAHL